MGLPFEFNCNWEPNERFIKNRYGRYIIKLTNQETIPLHALDPTLILKTEVSLLQ